MASFFCGNTTTPWTSKTTHITKFFWLFLLIKPLSYFKLLEYDEDSDLETETVYELDRSKKQTRSRNYDFVLHNQTLSTVERWTEPIKT